MSTLIQKSLKSAVFILKLVIPFAILSDILQYFHIIDYIAPFFERITNSLHLPAGVALALASGVFLNIYAAIAIAATFPLSGYEWTIIGVFVSICHSLPMEGAILKKVGVKLWHHFSVRFVFAYIGAYLASILTATDLALASTHSITITADFWQYLGQSIINAGLLALKVVVLVLAIIISFDLLKNIKIVKSYLEKHIYLSSLGVGGLIGITYGAAVLLQEIHHIPHKTKVLLLSFLLIAHALIEETLLYALFNADILNILYIRVGLALVLVVIMWLYLKKLSHSQLKLLHYIHKRTLKSR